MKALLPLCIACALALSACRQGEPDTTDADTAPAAKPAADAAAADAAATDTAAPATSDAMPTDQAAPNADAAALALLATINQHEIDAARQAKSKNVDGDVLAFAEMMETEHGANLEKTRTLGAASDTPDATAMKEKGKAELDALAAKSGDEYEKAYMEAMVKGHEDALKAIDEKMMPMATREEVRQHLTDTRKAVETHLARAKEIAGNL